MKTVGPILKKARQEKGLKIKEVFQEIKISPKFLKALEEGQWGLFSSRVHARGFLKIYAEFLGLNVDEVLAFWRREYKGARGEERPPTFLAPIKRPRFVITPGRIVSLATLIFIVLFLLYIFIEYRSFAGAPILIIDQPLSDTITKNDVLNVVGRTDPDAEVFINGQKVAVDDKGSFSIKLTLAAGANPLNFEAINKLGKTRKETRTVVLEKKTPQEEPPEKEGEVAATESAQPQAKEGLKIKIIIGPNSSWLRTVADEKEVFEGIVVAGGSKEFIVQKKVYLKTGNAGSTTVEINGVVQEPLGNEGEVVEKEYTKS
jgi:cytoskeletal protein RodZ